MTTILFGLKNCDKCRQALKDLMAEGRDPEFVDIRTEADLATLLPEWIETVGASALINTRSATWRGLSETERERAKTDAYGLLREHPTLIKRPVISSDGDIGVGWLPKP
ncbi:MAG: ArsC/Spx/MgsR family protein [Parvularcula sp.]